MKQSLLMPAVAAAVLAADAAQADISISNKPTQNMDCVSGVCTATAQKAVLNVGNLQTMLASGDVTVKTGALARDIDVDQPLTWATTSRLTLDAKNSVAVNRAVTVTGKGGLTIATNDGGKNGDLLFREKGKIAFWDLRSSLAINGKAYALANTFRGLIEAIAQNPKGRYALASDYDAKDDGTYRAVPIDVLDGVVEGLGNKIANLSIDVQSTAAHRGRGSRPPAAAFRQNTGIIRDLALVDETVLGDQKGSVAGLVENNYGTVSHCFVSGRVEGRAGGGLVSTNAGLITASASAAAVRGGQRGGLGGLVGWNGGTISQSFATGAISNGGSNAGGLADFNEGEVRDSYSTGSVDKNRTDDHTGGLIEETHGSISTSYSTGFVGGYPGTAGGLIGWDAVSNNTDTYWDLDTSNVSDPARGAGNIANDPGITGLSDAELKSELPDGFDPNICASDPNINNGYPYLLANPPR